MVTVSLFIRRYLSINLGKEPLLTYTEPSVDLGIASEAYAKAKAFVAPLNNKEKIAIVDASDFTGTNGSWSAYKNTDGVNGVNFYFYVSAFSAVNALTQTWDRDLYVAQFRALGEEYFSLGLNLIDGALLGPLGRVPEGGRQNEAFSPDPYLSGIAVSTGVTGQTDAGVIAGVRHFLLYEQETNRMGQGSETAYSSNVDDKTLHEVYMWPWGDAIQAGAMAVMCAMPRVNDTYSCSNNELLEGKLKTDLGFPGFVYPDESAQKTSVCKYSLMARFFQVFLTLTPRTVHRRQCRIGLLTILEWPVVLFHP